MQNAVRTITVLPKSRVLTLKTVNDPNATGVYTLPCAPNGSSDDMEVLLRDLQDTTAEMRGVQAIIRSEPDEICRVFTIRYQRSNSPGATITFALRVPPETEQGLKIIYNRMIRRRLATRKIALGMGTHARLGKDSPFQLLDPATLAIVARFMSH